MRYTLMLIGGLCVLAILAGQTLIQATTENGNTVLLHADGTWTTGDVSATQQTVVLHPDGTWTYQELLAAPPPLSTSSAAYHKPSSANTYVAGDTVPYGIWFDPQQWQRAADEPGKVVERRFTHASGEAWGAVIAEPTRLSLDYVKDFVLQSARKHMTDAEIVLQEKRVINGHEVMFLHIRGQHQATPLTYLNYDYVGDEGTVQIYTWTSQNLVAKHQQDMMNLLNGFDLNAPVN